MKDKMFIIMERTGEWEISNIIPVGFVDTEEEANEVIVKLIKEHKRICDLAIKNDYSLRDTKDCSAYSMLIEEFHIYIQKKFFPQDKKYEFYDNEPDKVEELCGKHYDSVTFKEWCKNEKGFSDEIIEATIKYNSKIDFDEKYYFFKEINRITL